MTQARFSMVQKLGAWARACADPRIKAALEALAAYVQDDFEFVLCELYKIGKAVVGYRGHWPAHYKRGGVPQEDEDDPGEESEGDSGDSDMD